MGGGAKYFGERSAAGCNVYAKHGPKWIPLRLQPDLAKQSPAVYDWGHACRGAVQLSLAILADHLNNRKLALKHHRHFNLTVVAHLNRNEWLLTAEEVDQAVENITRTSKAPGRYPRLVSKQTAEKLADREDAIGAAQDTSTFSGETFVQMVYAQTHTKLKNFAPRALGLWRKLMKNLCSKFLFPVALSVLFLIPRPVAGQDVLAPSPVVGAGNFTWKTVVNNGVQFPGNGPNFNSYNQPSVNLNQVVVFRARSKGGSGSEPAHGIFTRNMATEAPLTMIFDRNTIVPQPNNLDSTFTEPPAFPRIDMSTDTIASRGNHPPVWEYTLLDGSETRAGTTGIYYSNSPGYLVTGASNLGAVPGFSFFAVPGTNGIKFDVFPGAPSVTEGNMIVFKGNYTEDGASKTGAYFRVLSPFISGGGTSPAVVIADTNTEIPGTSTKFGSVAPPSAAGQRAVFAGFDNEDDPKEGGIYLSPVGAQFSQPQLTPLVEIGSQVPGEKNPNTVFNKLSEGLSFDGRYVAFWGAWDDATTALTLHCSSEGNKDRVKYCNDKYPNGYQTTVPKNQGIFVYDTVTEQTWRVAKTPADFSDFIYWNFSGVPPGAGESVEPGEPARWRSSTFMAVSGAPAQSLNNSNFRVAFKARTGRVKGGMYENPKDGIYLVKGPDNAPIVPVIETGTNGTLIDPGAVGVDEEGSTVELPVTELGIERDGFRGNNLVINATMGTEEAGWAGIYMTTVPTN